MAIDRRTFEEEAARGRVVFLSRRLLADRLTPVLAYRRLVAPDDRTAPSFLFESVETGARVGRWSLLGARPDIEVIAHPADGASGVPVEVIDHRAHVRSIATRERVSNPIDVPRRITAGATPVSDGAGVPETFHGGWVGFASYDSARWLEPGKLPFSAAPVDDRGVPDLHFGLYREVVAFDHATKTIIAIVAVDLAEHADVESAWAHGSRRLDHLVEELSGPPPPLPAGMIDLDPSAAPSNPGTSNFDRAEFLAAVERARAYIAAGDAFQIVISQRFRRTTTADPFEVYRALRVVNPSPYQIYLQARGCLLVASSPEILCRVRDGVVTNRPLAGTRRRGRDEADDLALEAELLADAKERAEHVMLVDLGRNDLGRVSELGSVRIERCMEIERYSHVMHISSTLTGRLREGLDCWDALQATLPVGTVSGAPKVRAMQIVDELERTRRGPYAGGIGAVGFDGDMDIALALRTIVVPVGDRRDVWTMDLQAGAGVVLDSDPASEFDETVDKSAALARAIDLAERMFAPRASSTRA